MLGSSSGCGSAAIYADETICLEWLVVKVTALTRNCAGDCRVARAASEVRTADRCRREGSRARHSPMLMIGSTG